LLAEEVAFACCIEVSRANGSLAVGTITGEVVGIPSPPRDFAKLNLAKNIPVTCECRAIRTLLVVLPESMIIPDARISCKNVLQSVPRPTGGGSHTETGTSI
jgi:hypothetical protein